MCFISYNPTNPLHKLYLVSKLFTSECIRTRARTHACACKQTRVRTRTHGDTHTHKRTHVHARGHTRKHMRDTRARTHALTTRARTCTQARAHMQAHMRAHTRTQAHTSTHTRTRTHKHALMHAHGHMFTQMRERSHTCTHARAQRCRAGLAEEKRSLLRMRKAASNALSKRSQRGRAQHNNSRAAWNEKLVHQHQRSEGMGGVLLITAFVSYHKVFWFN